MELTPNEVKIVKRMLMLLESEAIVPPLPDSKLKLPIDPMVIRGKLEEIAAYQSLVKKVL